jgi:hypothetical protein
MRSIMLCRRGAVASIATAAASMLLWTYATGVMASVHPAGGGAFSGGAEGWQATEESCNVTALSSCESSGEYDGSGGNPPGSMSARTSVLLILAALFESTVVVESPDFTVTASGPATLHLDRRFTASGLLTLSPEVSYTVSLVDRGGGAPTVVLGETLDEGDGSFAGRDAIASVLAGHTYALSIATETTSATALGLLGGETVAGFDNVGLSIQSAGAGGGGEPGGAADGGGGGAGAAPPRGAGRAAPGRRPRGGGGGAPPPKTGGRKGGFGGARPPTSTRAAPIGTI